MPITVTTKSSGELYAEAHPEPAAVVPEKAEEPKVEPPKTEEPPKAEEPKTDEPKKAEEPKPEVKAEEPKVEEPKKKHNERRFEQLTKDLGFYRNKAEMLEAEMRAKRYEEQKPQAAQAPQGVPARDAYPTDEEYVNALTAYHVRKNLEEAFARQNQSQAVKTFQEKVDNAKSAYEDYDEVVQAAMPHPLFSSPGYAHVADAVRESEYGPDLVYYLASNQDEADKVAAMSPISAIRYIGRIENLIEGALAGRAEADPGRSKETVVATKAPAPYQTPAGTGQADSGKKSIYDKNLTQAEFRKLWRAEMQPKR